MDNQLTPSRDRVRPLGSALVAMAILFLPMQQSAGGEQWLTGSEFHQGLTRGGGLSWREQPLRPALQKLGKQFDIAIFLDRRVDPSQTINLNIENKPLYEVLDEIAAELELELAVVGSVVYVGPPTTANALGCRVRDMTANKTPTAWRRSQPLAWPRLTEPRSGLERIFAEQSLDVTGIERVPHDLWDLTDLPPLPLAIQTQIVLAGFDLELTFGATQRAEVRSLAGKQTSVYSATYTIPKTFAWDAEEIGAILGKSAVVNRVRQRAVLKGTSWQHAKLAAKLTVTKSSRSSPGEVVFSMSKTRGTLRQLAPAFAARLKLQLELSDKISAATLDQVVEISVTNATRTQLLDAVIADTGLKQRVEKDTWIIEPK
jgi:hypothetical protein